MASRNFPAIIAECKKQSPSAGVIRLEYDPVSISKVYEACGAGAISVLSDSQYFGGSIEDVRNVSASVRLPVIRKDFIIDELQIDEARAYGASAILLIVRILSPKDLKRLHDYSKSLGMDVLVETHNRSEIDIAVDAGAEIIGINTRDLDNFQIYSNLVHELADSIPNGILKIGESGIHSRSDWENLNGIVDGFLIGTYFMKSPNIEKAYRDLLS